MLRSVEGVPKLGDNIEIASLADAFVEGSLDAFTGLDFVTVVGSGVEESVAVLNGLVDDLSACFLWHLPETETKLGKLVASAQDEVSLVVLCGSVDHSALLLLCSLN